MKKWMLTLTTVTLCLGLVACSSGDSGASTSETTSTVSGNASEKSVGNASEGTSETGSENATKNPSEGVSGGNRGNMELPEGFETMTSEEKMAYMSEMGVEIPDMSEREAMMEGMERPEGMTRPEGVTGGAGMVLPEGIELPEGFESMSSEEKMTLMSEMGVEIPDMADRESMRGEMTEGATRPNMAQGENGNSGGNGSDGSDGSSDSDGSNDSDSSSDAVMESSGTAPVEGETLVGEVVAIRDNVFDLTLTDGSSKTIEIPKDLSVANGDYTRILEGMNITFMESEDGTVVSVAITK